MQIYEKAQDFSLEVSAGTADVKDGGTDVNMQQSPTEES